MDWECRNGLDKLEGGKRLRKGEARRETVLVDYGNASSSGSMGGGEQMVVVGSNAGNDGLITSWAKPRFCYYDDVKVVVSDEVRDRIGFSVFADGLRIKKA